MEHSILKLDPSVICFVLFVLMLVMIAFGNKVRKKVLGTEEGDTRGGVNSLLGALFGLWSFILAFSFSQSSNRFDTVKSMIVDEANILRTSIIKADLFPDSIRNVYRKELKSYLEQRIAYYDFSENSENFDANRKELTKTATELWKITVAQSRNPQTGNAAGGMQASLTSLFDIGIKREALLASGIPTPIALMLMGLALAISFIGGFTTPIISRKEWFLIAVFALLASTVLYITIDLARPMEGFIKPDAGQITIVKLRSLFS